METQRAQAEILANRVREAVVASLVHVGGQAHWMGVRLSQEEWGAALVIGILESLSVILAEAFDQERDRLPHIFPRCEEILRRTVEYVWKTEHVPDCDCSD